LRRAREHGRGRRATHPLQIPWVGWKDILWRTYTETFSDRLLSIAGGVAACLLPVSSPGWMEKRKQSMWMVRPCAKYYNTTINERLSRIPDLCLRRAFASARDKLPSALCG
jgi:hypothetical protein